MSPFRALSTFFVAAATFACAQEPARFHRDHVLGTSLDLAVTPAAQGEAFLGAVLAEVARLEALLSTWKQDTPLAKLNRGETITAAAPEVLELLELADTWRTRTNGAFDVRVASAIAVWQAASKQGSVPADAAIEQAVQAMHDASFRIDRAQQTVAPQGKLLLSVDGLAKGCILDKALAAAKAKCADVTGALLDIGGDEIAFGKGNDGKPWRIGVADPQQPQENAPLLCELAIADRGVATSGGYARGFDIGGTHYSHILDPGTGRPQSGVLQATVVAADAATADALATALCVLDPADGIELAQSLRGVDCLLIDAKGKRHLSRGFAKLMSSEGGAAGLAGGFPRGNQLEIALTLPKLDVRRYDRPYTAVWVEDAQGKTICTLALWGRNRRWVSELTGWWKAIAADATHVDAVGRASRGPGEYRLVWGGCDDDGNPVGAGDYTIVIEVSREHGGHTTARQKVSLGDKAADWKLDGNKELEAATLHYGPRRSAK